MNKNKIMVGVMTLMSCFTAGSFDACVLVLEDGTHIVNRKCSCGIAYIDSCNAVLLVRGEGYSESKDSAECADEQLPQGEHPLDDENIDNWNGKLD